METSRLRRKARVVVLRMLHWRFLADLAKFALAALIFGVASVSKGGSSSPDLGDTSPWVIWAAWYVVGLFLTIPTGSFLEHATVFYKYLYKKSRYLNALILGYTIVFAATIGVANL